MFDQFFVALFGFVHLFVASFGCDKAGDEVVVPFIPFVFIVTVVSIVTVVVSTRRHTPHRCMTILAIVVLFFGVVVVQQPPNMFQFLFWGGGDNLVLNCCV